MDESDVPTEKNPMKKLKPTSVEAASVNTHGNLLTVATATPFVSHTVERLLHSMQSRLCFCMILLKTHGRCLVHADTALETRDVVGKGGKLTSL